jgi:hypothetical protein
MKDPKPLHPGDPCPNCGNELKPVAVPTPEQSALAADRENPIPLPDGMDTATPAQRKELGALHRCVRCSYKARFLEPTPEYRAPRPV